MIECRLENGALTSFRHATVDAIVLDSESRLLLVRRAEHLSEGGKWALPGGFVDRDETVEQAVARELFEETGYECAQSRLFCVISNPNRRGEDRQNITFVFMCTPGALTGRPDNETTEVAWFAQNEMPPEREWAFDHFATAALAFSKAGDFTGMPLLL